MNTLRYILIVILALLSFFSCGKEEELNVIPVYPVNFKINLNSTDAILRSPGSYKEYLKPVLATQSVGYGGLIIVNSIYATNVPDLFAFDLSCPNEGLANIRVKGANDGTATCEKCGRVYDLMANGRLKGGSSELHLQRYRVRTTASSDIFDITR
ncbi:MAG: hypothetical protein ACK5KT_16345 [Dysgonomonas sp.]